VSGAERQIDRGSVYRVVKPGARAHSVVCLSERSRNAWLHDCVAVPIYIRPDAPPNRFLVPIDAEQYAVADVSHVQTISLKWVGSWGDACTGPRWELLAAAVREFLCIDQLLAQLPCGAGGIDPSGIPAPAQGTVRYRRHPETRSNKMHVIVTDDAWSVRSGASSAVRLTSSTKLGRADVEVLVPGGTAIVSDLSPVRNGAFQPEVPRPPRPDRLDPPTMARLATRLADVLGL
jgi:hypothetical protein